MNPGDGRLDAACPELLNSEILWFQFHMQRLYALVRRWLLPDALPLLLKKRGPLSPQVYYGPLDALRHAVLRGG